MSIEPIDLPRFIAGLAIAVAFVFACAFVARWLRRKIIFSPAGRFLVKLGLENACGAAQDLARGRRYVVLRDFADYHGQAFRAGETLTFAEAEFVPYHGGWILRFDEKTMALQEEEQSDILRRIFDYLKPARTK